MDQLTATFATAAIATSNALLSGEVSPSDRSMLLFSAFSVIHALLRNDQQSDGQELQGVAGLTVELTSYLDGIVVNAVETDERLRVLRNVAKTAPCWPTMVRPGDPEFAAQKIERLRVGTDAVLRKLPKDAKRPPSLATPRNRLTLRLVQLLHNRASLIVNTSDDDIALQHIRITLAEAHGERAALLLPVLREIRTVAAWHPALNKKDGQ
jgi:hypothetical protein